MPSKSKAQQRFFGMVDAYKKGELKNPSKKIKKAAEGMTSKEVKAFAKTKQKGLPEKVSEQTIIRLTEQDLHKIVSESVVKVLSEGFFDIFKRKGAPIESKEEEPKDHIYSEKEMQWLYDNQKDLTRMERKVLNAGMWVRARQANYHGYAERWPNIKVMGGQIYYFDKNGEPKPIPD